MRESAVRPVVSLLLVMLLGAAVLVALAPAASAATFTVNSTGDDDDGSCGPSPSDCTLREAINAANNTTAKDTISFALGSGVPTISVGSTTAAPLPSLAYPVIMDGSSGGATRVELDGTHVPGPGVGLYGLEVAGGRSTISDLVINNFFSAGIWLSARGNDRITGCRIGTNTAGSAAEANGIGIVIGGADRAGVNVVGGTTSRERNLISGNTTDGIQITGSNGNIIEGNRIGTNASGTAVLGNGRDGINLNPGHSNVIGGTTRGARNLISGNGKNGVDISDTFSGINTAGTVVQGNLIGTNASGMAALPNGEDGIHFGQHPVNTLVGGTAAAARNVISGNTGDGVGLDLDGLLDSSAVIAGNYIGTDIKGTGSPGNQLNGVHIDGGRKILIGGTAAGSRNVISGNASAGIFIEDSVNSPGQARGNVIQGNFIGTNAAGTSDIENTRGISIDGQPDTVVGGTTRAARNVVSGNTYGFEVHKASGTVIQGNLVGTNAAGTSGIPNLVDGVSLVGSNQTLVGGTVAGAGNRIAFNGVAVSGGNGVVIDGGTGNSVLGNSIFSNKALGIDLDGDGVTPNDFADTDAGTNELQNFPVVTSAKSNGSITHVVGTIPSTTSIKLELEFFSSPSCDPSGHGEGKRFLGRKPVTTGTSRTGRFNLVFPVGTTVGHRVTATASSPGGSTSEFSGCKRVVRGR